MSHKRNISVLKKFARLDFLALEQTHWVLGKGFLHFRGACTVLGDPGAVGCSGNHWYSNIPNSLMVKLAVQGTPCAWHMLWEQKNDKVTCTFSSPTRLWRNTGSTKLVIREVISKQENILSSSV